MYFPQLSTPRQSRVTVSRFLGLDPTAPGAGGQLPGDGESVRRRVSHPDGAPPAGRGRKRPSSPGGLTVKEGLIWVDGHTLYVNGSAAGLVLSEGKKQLITWAHGC